MKKSSILFVLILFVVFCIAILAGCSIANAEIKFGSKVVVTKGFYKDCVGIVTDEMNDQTVVPAVKLYWADLVCKDDEGRDRNVVVLLPASDVRELRFKHCDKNTCDNR